MNYRLIRSRRKTLSLEITHEGELLVRAPMQYPRALIERFIQEKKEWITTHGARQKAKAERYPMPSEGELAALTEKARELLPPLVEKYASVMQVTPSSVRITRARKRFGSCSGKNALNFSCLLMRYPTEAIEYVVVHELAHILHHDHSKEFWKTVERYMPSYKQRQKILKGEDAE